MEMCETNVLNEYKHSPIGEEHLRAIARDVLLGLKSLHDKDIVHLDIKPENILKGASGRYKIGDLGLARLQTMLSGGINEGDSRYLAKEILNDDSQGLPDLRKADIFSLGIMLFEIMEKFKLPNNGPIWHKLRD